MWIFIALLAAGAILYFLLHDSPDDRLRKANTAMQAGDYPAATKQIDWLLEHKHPSAAATLARLSLVKAQAANKQGKPQQAFTELDSLYGVRKRYPAADSVLLAVVEKEAGAELLSSVEALAKPAEKARNWTEALTHYEAGIKRASNVQVLNGDCLSKLYEHAIACHEQLLRTQVQPKLTAAASLLPLGKYEEAEQNLMQADGTLRGPFGTLQERAAAKLRPVVQAQRVAVQQARLVAEATRLLVQARRDLESAGPFSPSQLTQVLDSVTQARQKLTAATKTGMPTHAHATTLQTQATQLSARALRYRGESYERGKNWLLAHQDYEAARVLFHEGNDAVAGATMQLRQSIVAIKSGTGQVVTDAGVIRVAEEKVRLDMAYRAAVSYLQAGQFETAALFTPHLKGHLPEATALAQAVSQQRLQALRQEVEQATAQAQDEQASFIQLNQLYDKLPALARRVTGDHATLGQQLTALRPYVFGRLLTVGLAQGQMLPLLDILTAQPEFHANPELLKNVGIVCLQLATTNGLTTANYQRVVAWWLTALHTNEVLLASLESTTWDDPYTFTLADSLGARAVTELPENVNRLAATESNISLGEAQRELMRAFEADINSITNSTLQAQIVSFYDQQKKALASLIEQLDLMGATAGQVKAAAPYAATQFNANAGVVNFLMARYQRELKEQLLDCALPYQTSPSHPQLAGYEAALELERKAVACFASPRPTKLAALPALLKTGAPHLKSYAQLQRRLVQRLTDEVQAANAQEDDGVLVSTFEALVTAFPAHEPFKVIGAHHLCEWCIGSVNDKQMENTAALEWLVKGWEWVPDDERLASNLCIVFGNTWHQADGPKQSTTLQQLEKIINRVSPQLTRTLKQAISTELLPTQQDLYKALARNNIAVINLLAAARTGYSSQYTPQGIEMGKRLLVLQKMTALAA